MANISLKTLITEAEDFKARSKETGKLVHFKSKDAYQAAIKAGSHEDPKAEKGGQPKTNKKPNSMFGGDYAKDRGGETPKVNGMATVNSIAAKTGLRAQAVAGWADENGVNLSKVSDDLESKKLKPFDLTTAVVGKPGNNYSKAIIAKYSQSSSSNNTNWMDNIDDIDVSDVKGKADPNADSFKGADLYSATFKDPETGKEITVGDAYEREDDSEAYKKAFAYVAKFDPDKEVVMGHPEYGKEEPKTSSKLSSMLPKKEKSITDIKVDKQVDVSMISKSILPNLRLADGSGYPDKDAVELKKRLDSEDSGVYTRTSPSGGNIVFKDGTKFEVFRPHDFTKTKSTTIYASKR